jgi:hypothetical protein
LSKALHNQIKIEQNTTQSNKDWTKHHTDIQRSNKTLHRQIKIEQSTAQSNKDWTKHYTDK